MHKHGSQSVSPKLLGHSSDPPTLRSFRELRVSLDGNVIEKTVGFEVTLVSQAVAMVTQQGLELPSVSS